MTFRVRLTLLVSLAVAVGIVGTACVVYYADRAALIDQLDSDLVQTRELPVVTALINGPSPAPNFVARGPKNLTVRVAKRQIVLPGSATALQVRVLQRSSRLVAIDGPRFANERLSGVLSRVYLFGATGKVVSISGSLADVDRNLTHLRWLLVFISLGGIGASALIGALVSGRAVAPLRRLAERTERIVDTGDLSERIGHSGRDEISRLSTRLDELLEMLEGSLRAQRQLVADASHELRTPIATLRANFELLAAPGILPPAERGELLADVGDELESMTTLVGELVELARGEEPNVVPRQFRLDEIVRAAVDRAARRAPDISFQTRLEPSLVTGVPERVERAVTNLLDNARKWSPPQQTVDVAVRDGVVEVRDHGPGIESEDLPLIFNRFYRSAKARGMPGAGLGLAIVKQIADAHGGSVSAALAPDGGAILRLQLATAKP